MLERQQSQLVAGLQELYRRNVEGEGWPGSPLKLEAGGSHPLTHDVLDRLGLLKNEDDQTESQPFAEDLEAAQMQLFAANGSGGMQRQGSSDASSPTSDCSQAHQFMAHNNGFVPNESFANGNINTNANGFAGQAQLPPTPPHQNMYHAQMAPQARSSSSQLRNMSHSGHPHQVQMQRPTAQRQAQLQQHLQYMPQTPQQQQQYQQQQRQLYLQRQQQQQQQQRQAQSQQSQSQFLQPLGQSFFPLVPGPPIQRQPSFSSLSNCSTLDDSADMMRGLEPSGNGIPLPNGNNNGHFDYLQQQDTSHSSAAPAPVISTTDSSFGLPVPGETLLNSGFVPQRDWDDSYFKEFINTDPPMMP